MNDTRRSIGLLVAFVALWAAEEALTARVLGRYGLAQIVWLRFGLHLVLLWALCGLRDPASLWRTRRPLFQLARSSMLVGMPAFWIAGTERGLAPSALMSVFWLAPLLILGLAHALLRERVSRRVWLAAAVACAGVFALTGPHAVARPQWLVFPLGMAVCFSLYVVMTRSLRTEPTRTNLFYSGLGVCLLLTPWVASNWVTPTAPDLLTHAGVALLGLGGLFALERLTATAPVSDFAPLVYLQIPFAIGIAWSLEQYDPSLRTLVGMLAIGAAAAFAWQHRPQRRPLLAPDTAAGRLE